MDPGPIIPMLLVLAVMYFLIVQPQVKEQRQHEALVKGLVKDDEVVTRSGLHGRVVSVADDTCVLEIAKNTRVTLDKDAVVRKLDGRAAADRRGE